MQQQIQQIQTLQQQHQAQQQVQQPQPTPQTQQAAQEMEKLRKELQGKLFIYYCHKSWIKIKENHFICSFQLYYSQLRMWNEKDSSRK